MTKPDNLSEIGLWKTTEGKKPEDMVQTIEGTVLDVPYSIVVKESTAKGVGNYFHRAWQDAVSGRSNEMPVFVAWCEIEIYQSEIPDDELGNFISTVTDDEWYLWQLGATLEGIKWYRNKLKSMNGDTWIMQSDEK